MDGLAGGLYDQMVRQVKGLDCIVEGGGTVIGCAGGVGQGAGIDSWDQAVLVADIGHEFGILGALTTSAHLSATTTVVAALSLGGSVSATTTIGPTLLLLLLLLGELGVHLLALYSAELVGLRGLSAAATRCALLFKGEGCRFYDAIGLQSFDLARQGLGENLSYDLHSRRELAEDDHCLHVSRELEAGVLEVGEVAKHLHDHGSGGSWLGSRWREAG